MQSVALRCYELNQSNRDGLVRRERPRPAPKPGEVLVQKKAASRSFRDLMVVGGVFPLPRQLVPVGDGAGVVIEIGTGVDDLKVGHLVCPVFLEGRQSKAKADVSPPPTALGGFQVALEGLCVVFKEVRIQRFVVGNRQLFKEMCNAANQHGLKPVIGQEIGFDDLPAAYRAMKTAAHVWKVGIQI